ncbi:MAG TPA: DUF6519 domain-containing protein [Pyrinomonadaceae bacterium]|nr:DUF6519 domain-containing protein [Pyrinomonadaceae bacterium]
MNGDLSRVTFNPLKHFTSIVLQQGRVQMDSDANEQTAILLHHLRSMAADLIGPHGGPGDVVVNNANNVPELRDRNCGFAIIAASGTAAAPTFFPNATLLEKERKVLTDALGANRFPLAITGGHYYVDGRLVENENAWLYRFQPYLERFNDEEIRKLTGVYLVYLDVWERFVSSVDDPSIREVALGGADTAARMKLIWQVKLGTEPIPAPPNGCEDFSPTWPDIMDDLEPGNSGQLRARARASESVGEEDVCITSPEARYRGLENQLYRVEVHRGGPAMDPNEDNMDVAATFKWSRNNATNVVSLKEKIGDRLIVSGLRDFSRWFKPGDWIEITHDALELRGLPGTLVRLAGVEGETLTIDPYTTSGTIHEPGDSFDNLKIKNLKVRGWDHTQPEDDLLIDGAIPIEEGQWLDLEDGIQIFFERNDNRPAEYQTGDYWLIPARVATGDVEWPQRRVDETDPQNTDMEPKPLPPNGIDHHFAPLAAVTLAAGTITQVVDLRKRFAPLAQCANDNR